MKIEGAIAFMAYVRAAPEITDIDPKTLGALAQGCETRENPFSLLTPDMLTEAQKWTAEHNK